MKKRFYQDRGFFLLLLKGERGRVARNVNVSSFTLSEEILWIFEQKNPISNFAHLFHHQLVLLAFSTPDTVVLASMQGKPPNNSFLKHSSSFFSYSSFSSSHPRLIFCLKKHLKISGRRVNGAVGSCKLGLPVIWSLLPLVEVGPRRPSWAPPGPTLHAATHP